MGFPNVISAEAAIEQGQSHWAIRSVAQWNFDMAKRAESERDRSRYKFNHRELMRVADEMERLEDAAA